LMMLDRESQAKERHAQALQNHIIQLQVEIQGTIATRQVANDSELASLDELKKAVSPALTAIERFTSDIAAQWHKPD
jgi:hypothetical protein